MPPKELMAKPVSDRLLALLKYAKSANPDMPWKAVPLTLSETYHPDMSLIDAMHHLVAAVEEVLADPRFEVGRSGTSALELLTFPIKGSCAVDMLGPKTLQTSYTLEQFYNSMAAYILSQLRISQVDWMAETLARFKTKEPA